MWQNSDQCDQGKKRLRKTDLDDNILPDTQRLIRDVKKAIVATDAD